MDDPSGHWNETDSEMMAGEMIRSMLEGAWLQRYKEENEDSPTLVVGPIRNEATEDVDEKIFIKEISRHLVNSGQIQFLDTPELRSALQAKNYRMCCYRNGSAAVKRAREIGADFIVVGTVDSSATDSARKDKTRLLYTVTLELIGSENDTKVWLKQKKIKKLAEPGTVNE